MAVLVLQAGAAVYYVANDGSDAAHSGRAKSEPLQTLAAAAAQLKSGDTLLLRRGDVFRESVAALPPGATVSDYGDAQLELPVVAGSMPITGWSHYTGSIYVAQAAYEPGYLFVDGALMRIARYPNTGWLRTTSWSDDPNGYNTVIQTASLASHPRNADGYWTNAWIRWRRWSWWFETRTVTNYLASGRLALGQKSISPHTSYDMNGWGFYLDNKFEELDAPGEWYYDKTRSNIYLWAPGGGDPNAHLVELSVLPTGMNVSGGAVSNIHFRQFKDWAVSLGGAGTIVRGCRFAYCGRDSDSVEQAGGTALRATWGARNALIIENVFISNLNVAINWNEDPNQTSASLIEDNLLIDNGVVDGYGGSGAWHASPIVISNARNLTLRRNRIFGGGYAGIIIGKPYNTIERNFITNVMATLNDGGGIYCNASYNYIRNNIILHSIGAMESSGPWANLGQGIWPEFLSDFRGSQIISNTVAHCGSYGLFLDNNFECLIRDNNFFRNKRTQWFLRVRETNTSVGRTNNLPQNHVMINNVMYAAGSTTQSFWYMTNNFFGLMQSNYFCNPYTTNVLGEHVSGTANMAAKSLGHWQARYAWADVFARTDMNKTDRDAHLFYNASDTAVVERLQGVYRDLDGAVLLDEITLAPWWSRILLRLATGSVAIAVSAQGPPGATGETGQSLPFSAQCSMPGRAELGIGTGSNAAQWTWFPLGAAGSAGTYTATGAVWLTAGTYYYAARWSVPLYGATAIVYGAQVAETNRTTATGACGVIVVTNTPLVAAAWQFEQPGSLVPETGNGTGRILLGPGLSSNWPGTGVLAVHGFASGTTGRIVFAAATIGRSDIGWYARLRCSADGPQTVDVSYSVNGVDGPWQVLMEGAALDDASTWRYLGGLASDATLANNPSAAFALAAYHAAGGTLEFDNVEIGALTPEPGGVMACILAVWWHKRRADGTLMVSRDWERYENRM